MQIVDLSLEDEAAIRQVAMILVEGFAVHWPEAYPTVEAALQEVQESLEGFL